MGILDWFRRRKESYPNALPSCEPKNAWKNRKGRRKTVSGG